MSFSNRRQPATRTGRPTPNLPPTYNSKIEKPKIAVNELYHLDETVGASSMLPSILNCSSKRLDQSTLSSSQSSLPERSQSARPTTNTISFPIMSSNSFGAGVGAGAGASASSNNKRPQTPPPPYVERVVSQENTDVNAAPAQRRSRSRNSSASSWIKRVVSRSSSRAKQYEQIPMSEEERAAAEAIRARRAERALAEWNRINDALKNAGF